jgi:hypothetical protein
MPISSSRAGAGRCSPGSTAAAPGPGRPDQVAAGTFPQQPAGRHGTGCARRGSAASTRRAAQRAHCARPGETGGHRPSRFVTRPPPPPGRRGAARAWSIGGSPGSWRRRPGAAATVGTGHPGGDAPGDDDALLTAGRRCPLNWPVASTVVVTCYRGLLYRRRTTGRRRIGLLSSEDGCKGRQHMRGESATYAGRPGPLLDLGSARYAWITDVPHTGWGPCNTPPHADRQA